jgi:hypothetical protein
MISSWPAPFIATWLLASYHSTIPISIYIVICAVISIVSSYLLTDYTNKDTWRVNTARVESELLPTSALSSTISS